MSAESLPSEVIEFLRAHVKSVEQLEILALLHRDRTKALSASRIFQEIRTNEASIAGRLTVFAGKGILMADETGAYRYEPANETLDRIIQDTLQAYRTRPVLVIETIFRPDDAARKFSDAFRFRKS